MHFLLRDVLCHYYAEQSRANKIYWNELLGIFIILRIMSWRDEQPAEVIQRHMNTSSTASLA